MTDSTSPVRFYFRSFWLAVLTAALAAAGAFLLSSREEPTYRASTKFIVSPEESGESEGLTKLNALERATILPTYAEILASDRLRRSASRNIPEITPADVRRYQVNARVLPRAHVLVLSVEGPDPDVVPRLANAIGRRAAIFTRPIYPSLRLTVLDRAPAKGYRVAPTPGRDAAIAGFLGFLVGCVLVLLRVRSLGPAEETVRQASPESAAASDPPPEV